MVGSFKRIYGVDNENAIAVVLMIIPVFNI